MSTVPAAFEIDHTLTPDAPLPQSVAVESDAAPAPAVEAPAPLSLALVVACDIASGKVEPDPAANAISIKGAWGSWNSRGTKGDTSYRMVWRDGKWIYFTEGRLLKNKWNGKLEGRCMGDVYEGEIVCEHSHAAQVDSVYLMIGEADPDDGTWGAITRLTFTRARDGLRVQLPTGAMVTLPDPRKK